jgi:hypothetical protein
MEKSTQLREDTPQTSPTIIGIPHPLLRGQRSPIEDNEERRPTATDKSNSQENRPMRLTQILTSEKDIANASRQN